MIDRRGSLRKDDHTTTTTRIEDTMGQLATGLGALGALTPIPGVNQGAVNSTAFRLWDAAHRLMYGTMWIRDYAEFMIRDRVFFHSQSYPAAGQASFTFFNAAQSNNVTNWNGGNGNPLDEPFVCTGISFDLELGRDTAGAAIAGSSLVDRTATTDVHTFTQAIREAYTGGIVNLRVGQRSFVENEKGLQQFPSGYGVETSGVSHGTTASIEFAIIQASNGKIGPDFQHRFQYPIFVPPQQSVELTVNYPAVIALPAAAVLTARMHGCSIKRAGW